MTQPHPALTDRWLLLIHQIPPKPSYFRVKIWRRLQQLGAVAIKNSVYALPRSELNHESFQWIMKEIAQGKGEASICGASFMDGLEDAQVEGLFNEARNREYAELAGGARKLTRGIPRKSRISQERRREIEAELGRMRKRLSEISAIDFFGASGREVAGGLIDEIESKLHSVERESKAKGGASLVRAELRGRTWVTRRGAHVDRIASAWLIQRFIDPDARFKFVDVKTYRHESKELRFDMFEGEFTHEGDLCSFEVLIERANLEDHALRQIAETVHDIDLRDEKYQSRHTPGIEAVINAICLTHKEDSARIIRGKTLFDDLYEYFTRRRK